MRKWDEYKKTMQKDITLWSAARANDLKTIYSLIKDGHDVNAKDHRGYSPLMLAIYSGHHEASLLLLQMGADPNSTDLIGNSILMGAAFKGHVNLVNLLLESGADARAKNHTGLTALDFATTFGRQEVASILKSQDVSLKSQPRMVGLVKILLGRFA